jgi:hypothetical protein
VPIFYEYVNLLTKLDSIEDFQRISQSIIIPYSTYIHTLYIYVDSTCFYMSRDTEKYAAGILSACRRLITLGLYFHHGVHWPEVSREVVFLAEKGKLAHLGIYSQHILEGQVTGDPAAVNSLIISLAQSPLARRSIKTLELAVDSISTDTFASILSDFPSLQSLTFRKALDKMLSSPSGHEPRKYWIPYEGLKRLQLTKCDMGLLARIPALLHLFPTLKELLVSGIGSQQGRAGGNQTLDIPHQPQIPLELLHLESMNEQEMLQLVDIPTISLVLASMKLRHVTDVLQSHAAPFPGVRLLQIEPLEHRWAYLSPFWDLREICKARNIEIQCNALSVFSSRPRQNRRNGI